MSLVRVSIIAALCVILAGCGSPEERAAKYLASAEKYYAEGNWEKANLEARNAAQIEPKNARARYLLAELALKEGKARDAVGHLLVAVESDPDYLDPRLMLATFYFAAQAEEEAKEQTEAATRIAPDNPKVDLLNARLARMQGDDKAAMALAEKALERDPMLTDAVLFKAALLVSEERYDEGLDFLEASIPRFDPDQAKPLRRFRLSLLSAAGREDEIEPAIRDMIRDYPDEKDFNTGLVQLYMREGRVDDAEQALRDVLERNPDDIDRQIQLAQFLASQRSREAAEELLRGFVEENPDSTRLRLALGNLLEVQERYDDAITVYDEVVDMTEPTDDDSVAASNRKAAVMIKQGRQQEARQLVEEILRRVPDNPTALMVRAAFNYQDGDYDATVADVRLVLRKEPDTERALLLLGRAHARMDDVVLAQDAYRRLLTVNPRTPFAANELAALYASQGDLDKAEEVLESRLETVPDDVSAVVALITIFLGQEDYEAAERQVDRLAEIDSESGVAEFQRGRLRQAQGNPSGAIDAYKASLEKNPDVMAALQSLVALLFDNGRGKEAIAYLRNYLNENPDQRAAQFLLGTAYAQSGDKGAAEQEYDKIIEVEPGSARIYTALAGLYPDDPERRIEIFQRGLAANPNNAVLSFLLATELERADRHDEAIDIYERLYAANEANDLAVNNLAALLLDYRKDTKSHERALELATRFRSSQQPALVDTLGWAYYRTGDYQNAVRYLELAVAGASESSVLRYHLGMAYLAVDNTVGARQELEKAIELAGDQGFAGIDETREALENLKVSG